MRTQIIDGYRFIKDEQTGYWQSNQFIKTDGKPKRLHRYVWEKYHGAIPTGYQVHHIDKNKDNNSIENLELLSEHDHQSMHGKERFANNKEWFNKFHSRGIATAPEWHKSRAGHEWHKEHYEKTKSKLYATHEYTCIQCGKQFVGHYHSKYCSGACKAKYRRANHLDDEERTCIVCGKTFSTNKYRKAKTCSRSCAHKITTKSAG